MTRPTLSFVHGFMGHPSDWDDVRANLGDYESVAKGIPAATCWEEGINKLLDEIPRDSVLIGYSMGARLSLGCALARPESCRGLVFVSGNPGLEDATSRQRRLAADEEIAQRMDASSPECFLEWWYTQSSVFRSLTDPLRADEIQRKLAHHEGDWSAMLRTFSVALQPNYWSRLQDVRVPFLAVAGVLDHKYTRIVVRMEEYASIETRIIPGCGHIVHREQPHVFLSVLREYLQTNFAAT